MLGVHLDGAFHLSQPAYRADEAQGYGRFVFIASSAGLFGQPNSAHYAAAKAGTLGLANVIAIEGAAHGILANCVLPFGYSGMVFETVGDRDDLEPEPGFLHAIEPELGRADRRLPRQPRAASSPTTTSPPAPDASPASSSGWARAGSPSRAAARPPTTSPTHLERRRRSRALHDPDVDLRRGLRGVQPARGSADGHFESVASSTMR